MKGEISKVPKYKPVAFKPLSDEDTPSRSKITEISGSNMPCEKPEIDTMATSTQKRLFAYVSCCTRLFPFQNMNSTYYNKI